MTMNFELAGIFDRAAPTSQAVKMHRRTCGMLKVTKSSGRIFRRHLDIDVEEALDLKERGFGVSFCKCISKKDRWLTR